MSVKLGQASYDEHGNIVGGAAGNQNGKELNFSGWWDNNWNAVIRFKDEKKRKICGDAAIDAVNNKHIGYDQGQRNTLLTQAKKVAFDLSKITANCETDCSALGSVCMIAAGAPEDKMFRYGNLAYTGNIVDYAKSTGLVTIYTSADYTRSSAKLLHGDVLVSSGHCAIVVSGSTASKTSTATASTASAKVDEVKYRASVDKAGKKWLNEYTGHKGASTNDGYAGIKGQPIRWLAMKFPGWYQVKTEKNGWLGKIRKYDTSDLENGCAGDGSPIVAIRCYYETQNPSKTGYHVIEYQAGVVGGSWLGPMRDLKDTGGSSDNFAGNGKRIDRFKARIVKA